MIIIKGAIYTNGDNLLRPHYSGDFVTVDCNEYKTKEEIKNNYSDWKKWINEDAYYLIYNGKKYYECEYSPYYTGDFELLSDISNLEFYDEETYFD